MSDKNERKTWACEVVLENIRFSRDAFYFVLENEMFTFSHIVT